MVEIQSNEQRWVDSLLEASFFILFIHFPPLTGEGLRLISVQLCSCIGMRNTHDDESHHIYHKGVECRGAQVCEVRRLLLVLGLHEVCMGSRECATEILNDLLRFMRRDGGDSRQKTRCQLGEFQTVQRVSSLVCGVDVRLGGLGVDGGEVLRSWCPFSLTRTQDLIPLLIEYANDASEQKMLFSLLR
jgi:hypothetical protein